MRAYYGVSAALSMGLDPYDLLDIRGQTMPGAARYFSAGRGITMPEPGRITAPHWITTEAEGRKAVRRAGRQEGRHRQDLGRYARQQVQEADAGPLWPDHRRGAQEGPPRHRAYLRSGGRQGPDPRRRRCVRARRPRPPDRRRVPGAVEAAPEPGAGAEPAGSRRQGRSELDEGRRVAPTNTRSSRRPTSPTPSRRRSTASRRAIWR